MAEKTAAQKKAQRAYMEKFAFARVRMDNELYEKVKAHAQRCGESINALINRAIMETMQRDQPILDFDISWLDNAYYNYIHKKYKKDVLYCKRSLYFEQKIKRLFFAYGINGPVEMEKYVDLFIKDNGENSEDFLLESFIGYLYKNRPV